MSHDEHQHVQPNDLDQRIWGQELDAFVPKKVFDVHTHMYQWDLSKSPSENDKPYFELFGERFPEASWDVLTTVDRLLMPGREVQRLAFGFPFPDIRDFDLPNDYVGRQVAGHSQSGALMLVHPSMTTEYLEERHARHGFLGLKPYRFYSSTGDAVECRMTDFLPEHQIEFAHDHGLLIMMHVSKRDAIADRENIEDLLWLTDKYPQAKWILAHCARSYSNWAIERVAGQLRGLPNVWYDTSSVCESDAIEALCRAVGPERVMYGSDDVPVGVLRGKYIAFGYAWAYLSEDNHQLGLSHCDRRMTFTRYEQLRAMRRAAGRLQLSTRQIECMFCDTAAELVAGVKSKIEQAGKRQGAGVET